MDLQKIGLKFFTKKGQEIPLASFIPLFHRFIQEDKLEGMLVDVAEYTHVHQGPGVLLIAHEANYSLDEEEGKRGFLYTQKRAPAKDAQGHLKTAFRRALQGCELLEKDPALKNGLQFDLGHFQVFVNDRMEAPFTSEALAALESELNPFLSALYGGQKLVILPEKNSQKRAGFEVRVEKVPPASELMGRLD